MSSMKIFWKKSVVTSHIVDVELLFVMCKDGLDLACIETDENGASKDVM